MQKWRKITFYLNEIIYRNIRVYDPVPRVRLRTIHTFYIYIFFCFFVLLLPFIGRRRRRRRYSASMSCCRRRRRQQQHTLLYTECYFYAFTKLTKSKHLYAYLRATASARVCECASFMCKIIIIIMKWNSKRKKKHIHYDYVISKNIFQAFESHFNANNHNNSENIENAKKWCLKHKYNIITGWNEKEEEEEGSGAAAATHSGGRSGTGGGCRSLIYYYKYKYVFFSSLHIASLGSVLFCLVQMHKS